MGRTDLFIKNGFPINYENTTSYSCQDCFVKLIGIPYFTIKASLDFRLYGVRIPNFVPDIKKNPSYSGGYHEMGNFISGKLMSPNELFKSLHVASTSSQFNYSKRDTWSFYLSFVENLMSLLKLSYLAPIDDVLFFFPHLPFEEDLYSFIINYISQGLKHELLEFRRRSSK